MADTFISYRREDSAGYAGRLRETLERRLGGGRIFRDVDTLQPGQDFVRAIDERVRQCRVFLALIGREWLDARDTSGRRRLEQEHDYVRLEIAAALGQADRLVIPVLVEGATMPDASALPDSIRTLAYRHAISLRDEAWNTDVDRLAAVIANSIPGDVVRSSTADRHGSPPPGRLWRWAYLGAGVVLLLILGVILLTRDGESDGTAAESRTFLANMFGASGSAGIPTEGPAYAIPVPRIAEVAHGNVIYTLISGSVEPRGNTSALRLRFRISNEGRGDSLYGDSSFRLAVGGDALTPTSGLSELIPGHSIDQAIVTFDVPAGATAAVLRVSQNDSIGELPLDLGVTGRPAEDERADAGDALSRAILFPLQREPVPLMTADNISTTLRSASSRRFANAVRLRFNVLLANHGRYGRGTGDVVVRLAFDDRTIAPSEAPSEVIQPASDLTADYVFDVPPATKRVILRAMVRDTTGELAFDLR